MFKKLKTYGPLQALTAGTAFVTIAIHTRFLSLELYGILAVFLVLSEFFVVTFSQWVGATMVRFFGDALEKNKVIGDSLTNLIFSLVLGAVFLLSICDFVFNILKWEVLFYTKFLLICLFVSKSVYNFFLDVLRLKDDLSKYSLVVIVQVLLSMSLTVVFLCINPSIDSAILSLLVSYLISLLFSMYFVIKCNILSFSFDLKLIKYGIPLIGSVAVTFLTNRSDRLILAELSNAMEVGVYAGLAGIAIGLGSLVFMVIALPLYPEVAKSAGVRENLILSQSNYSKYLIAFTLPILSLFATVADVFVPTILGDKFNDFNVLTFYTLIACAFLYNIKVHYVDHSFQFVNKTFLLLIFSIVSFLCLIFISSYFVPEYGALGLSVSVLLSSFISLLLGLVFIYVKGMPLGFSHENYKVIFSVMTAVALCSFFLHIYEPTNKIFYLIVSVFIFFICYFGMLVVFNFAGIRKALIGRFNGL